MSVLQFLLDLSDRGAAEAVRCRIDFKYALGPGLDDPGFHHSVLSDFRECLLEDGRADRLLDLALARLKEAGLVRERTTQRTDSTHVLAAVRDLTRLELVTEAVREALEEVAATAASAPAWSQAELPGCGAVRGLTSGAESGVHSSCARCCSVPVRAGRAGEAGGLMSEAAVPQSVTIAAVPERVGLARAFVAGVLGESHPCNDLAVLLASELVTNSVRHSGSAVPGGLVTVAVSAGEGVPGGGDRPQRRRCPRPAARRSRGRRRGGQPGVGARGRARRTMGLLAGQRVHDDVVRACRGLSHAVRTRRVPLADLVCTWDVPAVDLDLPAAVACRDCGWAQVVNEDLQEGREDRC